MIQEWLNEWADVLWKTVQTRVQIAKKQIVLAVVHKLEPMQVEDRCDATDLFRKELPVAGSPGHQISPFPGTPDHSSVWSKQQESGEPLFSFQHLELLAGRDIPDQDQSVLCGWTFRSNK